MKNKLKIHFIYGESKSSAFGINNLSDYLIKSLSRVVTYNIISYKKKFNLPFSGKFYRYLYYPIKSFLKVFNKDGVVHISSQLYGHICYLFLILRRKIIITCCDIIPLIYPGGYSSFDLFFYRISLSGLKKATKIIAISKSTKNDLIKYLKIPKQKIIVIYPGIDKQNSILKEKRKKELKKRLFSDKKVILYVGSYLKNKNINGLIKVFYEIHKEIKSAILVIVNEKEKMPNEYIDLMYNLGVQKMVRFTNHVTDQELVNIYNCSDILIYPSFYEGFGLPPLEAMACGCPVITSNTSSLPEVVGDAGIMVDHNDYNEIAKNAIMLLKNPEIRNKMIMKGLKQTEKFRNSLSEKVLDIYKELI